MQLQKLDFDLLSPAERQEVYSAKLMFGLVFRCDQLQTFDSVLNILAELRSYYAGREMPPLIVIGTFWDLVPESDKYGIEQRVKLQLSTVGLKEFYYVAANPPINIPVVYVRYTQLASIFYGTPDTSENSHKVLLIGNVGTGKSTLIQRFKDLGYGVEEKGLEENEPPAAFSMMMDGAPSWVEGEKQKKSMLSEDRVMRPPVSQGAPAMPSAPGGSMMPSPPSPSVPKDAPAIPRPPPKMAKSEEKKKDKKEASGRSKMAVESPAMRRSLQESDMDFEEREEAEDVLPSDEYGAEKSIAGLTLAPVTSTYAKNLSVEYFDKMNPEKYYPLIVNIANEEQAYIAPQENIVTGERKIQKKEVMEVELTSPKVTVRPILPGCSVTPSELITNFDRAEDELKFFITPLVNDEINGRIDFINSEGDVVYQMPLIATVDDPRYAKTIAAYGTLASVLPKLLLFFDVDIGNELSIESLIPLLGNVLGGALAGITLTNFIAFAGVIIASIVGGVIFIKRKPRSTTRKFTLGDLRVAKLKNLK